MLRATILTLGLASTCMAFLGDWKVWAPTHDARMAVVLENTAWVATGGGVMEWDLKAEASIASRMHSRRDGLPTMDFASMVLDSQKTLWAIGSDGRIGYRPLGASAWQSANSYASQGWNFTPRAALYWKNFLVLGTDKGLSLYSIRSMSAEDNVKSFGSMSGTVTAVMVTPGAKSKPDTLWVSLDAGALYYATPDWNSVGKPGHFLADPSKWTQKQLAWPYPNWTILEDSTGVHLGDGSLEWMDPSNATSIRSGTVSWPDGSVSVPGAVHAAKLGTNLVVSTSTSGTKLLDKNGIRQTASPEGSFPDNAPVNVERKPDGTWAARFANQILSLGQNGWVSDTIRFTDADGTYSPTPATEEDIGRRRQALAFGSKGETFYGSFGGVALEPIPNSVVSSIKKTLGGFYVSSSQGDWVQFGSNPYDTCISHTLSGGFPSAFNISGDMALSGAAMITIRSFERGTWMSTLHHTRKGRVLFVEPGGKNLPTCFDIPIDNLGSNINVLVYDFLPIGDTLWMGTNIGLARVVSPRPNRAPVTVATDYFKPANGTLMDLQRLVRTEISGSPWIVGSSNGRLAMFPASGSWWIDDTTRSTSLVLSDSSAGSASMNQNYVSLAVDAQGQIWAAGEKGIDIVQIDPPEIAGRAPSFRHVRRVTTADGLPDNQVWDMELDVSTGKAMVATPSAVALWTSPYRPIAPKLVKSRIQVWPNPVRLRQMGDNPTLFVDGATPGSRFDLLAADGTLVMHMDASQQTGGLFQVKLPDAKNLGKLRPGLYFWSVKDKNNSVRGPLLIAE